MQSMRMILVISFLALSTIVVPSTTIPAFASVYDSDVVGRLKLTGKQRAQVQRIIARSRSQRALLFRRNGINPNAKPQIFKLQRISSELHAIQAKQRAALSLILSHEQLRQYDAVIAETRSRVMRAAFQ
jgi:hypothetical protein